MEVLFCRQFTVKYFSCDLCKHISESLFPSHVVGPNNLRFLNFLLTAVRNNLFLHLSESTFPTVILSACSYFSKDYLAKTNLRVFGDFKLLHRYQHVLTQLEIFIRMSSGMIICHLQSIRDDRCINLGNG